jgi:peptidylprolyl isomerase domain and WD repeat-containing protein 1
MSTKKRQHDDLSTSHGPPPTNPLQDIPTTSHYAISFMHRSTITHSCVSLRHGYVLTGSVDGVVKFWKRTSSSAPPASASAKEAKESHRCLEFVKSYTSHTGPLSTLLTSQPNGDTAVSIGYYDGTIKFYDVASFDVSGMIRTKYKLGKAILMEREEGVLVVSVRASTREEMKESTSEKSPAPGSILLFSVTTLSSEPMNVISYHAAPVTAVAFHCQKGWVVSGDVSGVLEVWNVSSSGGALPFQSKLETDLYSLIKKKTYAIDIAISESAFGGNRKFAVYSSDRKIRLFSFHNCKLVCIYDERMKVYDNLLSSKSGQAMGIDAIEYGNRAALEREMEDANLLSGGVAMNPSTKQCVSTLSSSSEGCNFQCIGLKFDGTGNYLLLPTIVGVKVINVRSNKVVATVGKGDASSLRFLNVTICPGDAKVDQQLQLARMGGSSAAIIHNEDGNAPPNDSLIIALAYNKRRFYAFSHHDPLLNEEQAQNRDILNEAPDASDLLEASHLAKDNDFSNATLTTATTAILRTTHGDITIKLFPKETPKTIENFIGHAQSGYYDNVIFHRIIQGFMLQTGDPLGDGTGGESIWGGEFSTATYATLFVLL